MLGAGRGAGGIAGAWGELLDVVAGWFMVVIEAEDRDEDGKGTRVVVQRWWSDDFFSSSRI